MHETIARLHDRATAVAERYRAGKHSTDRVNRFCGRAEVIITRRAARLGEPVPVLYVSCDGQWLTTWPGQKVARVYRTGTVYGFHGTKLTCYSATIEGRHYYGRGLGEGMSLRLRAGKLV